MNSGGSGDWRSRGSREAIPNPTSQVSLVTADRRVVAGQAGPPLPHSFCRMVVDTDAPLLISDARVDDRVSGHPAIADGVIAYAGFPVRDSEGYPLGAFSVAHDQPRDWEPRALLLVEDLAAAAETEIALRAEVRSLRKLTALLADAGLTPARRKALLDASRAS